MNDPFGQAIHDFNIKGKAADLVINSNYTEDEKIPTSYLFRGEKEMPKLEQIALKQCRGKILDVGAAAGCHSIILQKKGFNITALEKSELAVEVMKSRGIQKVICDDIYSFAGKSYDTILLLMNGTGIGETIEGLKKLLLHLKSLLTENGQILIDSSDIKYLFEEEDGSLWMDLANTNYYGEMEYEVTYKNSVSKFKWLFVDGTTLEKFASEVGFQYKTVAEGNNHDYLAQLKL
ncbi:MAG: class I SAM-dependent methyltransferase [Bacteroidetes bacterium]|nr:class I SAM-dependent methyltransferase [Bacteroidota bacterium]